MKYYIDYLSAVRWLNRDLIMINGDIFAIDPDFEDKFSEDEDGNPREIFQRFITDFTDDEIGWMEKNFPDLLFSKCDKIDKWILCVDHWGTSWDYVWAECNLDWVKDCEFNKKNEYEYKIQQLKTARFMRSKC